MAMNMGNLTPEERQRLHAKILSGEIDPLAGQTFDPGSPLVGQVLDPGNPLQPAPDPMAGRVPDPGNPMENPVIPPGMAAEAVGGEAEIPQSIEGQERKIAGQREFANSLRGRGAPQGKTVGPLGVYVGPNWGESLAYAGEQALGGYLSGKANKADEELDEQRGALIKAAKAEEKAAEAEVLAREDAEKAAERAYREGRDAKEDARNEAADLAAEKAAKLAGRFELGEGDVMHDEDGNVIAKGPDKKKDIPKEIAKLEVDSASRQAGIEKAAKFLTAFNSGASSGTTEAVTAFFPGKFTDQSKFNEELDAFAESAARAELKAVGEIRPTDADVAGMKEALFGVGKDEGVNKNLFGEYLQRQVALENQLRSEKGEELMPMPDTSAVEGEDWYGTLFEQKPAAGPEKSYEDAEKERRYQEWKATQE